jgi:hypothetical protein
MTTFNKHELTRAIGALIKCASPNTANVFTRALYRKFADFVSHKNISTQTIHGVRLIAKRTLLGCFQRPFKTFLAQIVAILAHVWIV